MHTSYSALESYKNCPRKYKYQKIDGMKEPKRIEAVFGTLIHASLKFMFEKKPLFPTLDEIINFYTKKWQEKSEKIEWRSPDKKEAEGKLYFEEGVRILKNFYKKNTPWNFNPVDLEGRFHITLEDPKTKETHSLAGIIDRLDKNGDEYEIIDYKTGKKMPSEDSLINNLQLGLYSLAIIKKWPQISPEKIRTSLFFLKHNEKISVIPGKEILEKVQEDILNTIKEINNDKEFPPTPNPLCDYCGFKKICPMWSHEFQQEEKQTKDDSEMAEIIKEFFATKDRMDTDKKRVAEMRSDILFYMENKELGRVFGGTGYITKNVQDRGIYKLEAMEKLLRDNNLWEKILSPDSKKLEEILPTLPNKIQEQILETKEKKSVTTLKISKNK